MQATSTPKLIVQQPAFLVVLASIILAVGIAIAAVLPSLGLTIGSTGGSVSAPDTSYNQVENLRAQFGVAPDTSYDVVEANRAAFGTSVTAPVITERGYIAAKRHELAMKKRDELRGAAGWWASARSSTIAGTPVSQAEPNDRYGAGIR